MTNLGLFDPQLNIRLRNRLDTIHIFKIRFKLSRLAKKVSRLRNASRNLLKKLRAINWTPIVYPPGLTLFFCRHVLQPHLGTPFPLKLHILAIGYSRTNFTPILHKQHGRESACAWPEALRLGKGSRFRMDRGRSAGVCAAVRKYFQFEISLV
jgi:hypothetical protein